jgi:hypothetical protein
MVRSFTRQFFETLAGAPVVEEKASDVVELDASELMEDDEEELSEEDLIEAGDSVVTNVSRRRGRQRRGPELED